MRSETWRPLWLLGTLHVHKPRSPGRPCPHTPQGQGPLACSPVTWLRSHVPAGARVPSGPCMARRLWAQQPPPRRPGLHPPSPCTSHAAQTPPDTGQSTEQSTEHREGPGKVENSRSEDGTKRGPGTRGAGDAASMRGGGPAQRLGRPHGCGRSTAPPQGLPTSIARRQSPH